MRRDRDAQKARVFEEFVVAAYSALKKHEKEPAEIRLNRLSRVVTEFYAKAMSFAPLSQKKPREVYVSLTWSEHGDIARMVPLVGATPEENAFVDRWLESWMKEDAVR